MFSLTSDYGVMGDWLLHHAAEPVALPTPAAGAALTYTVPGAVQMLVASVCFTYTASAAVATRYPYVEFLDQTGTPVAVSQVVNGQAATVASIISFGVNVPAFGALSAARQGAGIPPILLSDGLRVRLSAVNIQAADTITLARLFVRQYPTEP